MIQNNFGTLFFSTNQIEALPISRKKAYTPIVTERYTPLEITRGLVGDGKKKAEAWQQRRLSAQNLALISIVLIDGGGDAEYIDDHLRRNHVPWHLILEAPDSVEEETAISAYNTCQLKQPRSAVALVTWIMHGLVKTVPDE